MNFHDKTVYQIYTKSFRDTNHDGFGDLRGVTEKLDYLRELGVDFLWLTPVFPSPQRDNGYDVADYCSIDPRYGTMADLEELIAEAGKRGMGLMLDMVFNHTSTEHEWFRKALAGDPAYMDYYLFRKSEKLPTNWVSKFGGPAWKYVPQLDRWYLHLFDEGQADLNWNNPKVREELKNVLRFWKGKGIQGFRFDVVNLISKPDVLEDDFEGDGRRFYTDGPHIHEFLRELVQDSGIGDMITVGEMSSTSLENCLRYSGSKTGELSMCFNFHHLKVDYRGGDKWSLMPPDLHALNRSLEQWQLGMQAGDAWNAVFWCNHDQPRIVSRLGDDSPEYRVKSAKMLATCVHLLRGTPYIFQGEELGMTNAGFTSIDQYRDVESLHYYRILLESGKTEEEALQILAARSRDNARTPMQWDDSVNGGFSDATPWISVQDSYREINAAAARQDPDSVFHFFQALIRLRKELPVIQDGDISFLYPETDGVLAYRRTLQGDAVTVLCSLLPREQTLPLFGSFSPLLGNYPTSLHDGTTVTLRPWEALVLRSGTPVL